jgi:dUTP diphosphatase
VSGSPVIVSVRRVRSGAGDLPLPAYQTEGASGMDLMADTEESVRIAPGERALIPTGLALEIPVGYEAQVRPRSGLALRHGVTLLNSPGTIDSDYRGELQVLMVNLGNADFVVHRGDRIAQMVLAPVAQARLREVTVLESTKRDTGGFGHTDEGGSARRP